MKGKLACLIGLTICGIIGWIAGGKHIQDLKLKQDNIDAELKALRQDEKELLRALDEYHQKTDEEIRKTQELIALLKDLSGIDLMNMDIQIDPE